MLRKSGVIDFFDVIEIIGINSGKTIGPGCTRYFCPNHGECTPAYLAFSMSGAKICYYDEWSPVSINIGMRAYCKQCLEELAIDLPSSGQLSPLSPWADELTKEDFEEKA